MAESSDLVGLAPPNSHLEAQPSIRQNTSTSEESSSTCTGATFSDLPFEIRVEIYRLAIPLSRVLRMQLSKNYITGAVFAQSMSAPGVPVIMHINRESRAVGLSIFRLSFGADPDENMKTGEKEAPGLAPRMTYWNPEIDILYLPFYNPPLQHPVRITRDYDSRPDDDDEDIQFEITDASHVGSHDVYHKHGILQQVRHLALHAGDPTRTWFSGEYPEDDDDSDFDDENIYGSMRPGELTSWILGFPHLRSLTFLDDPFPQWYRSGEILLYEPDEDSTSLQWFRDAEDVFAKRVEKFKEDDEDWTGELPSVEMLVMGNKKTRKPPAFCVQPKKVVWG